MWNDVTLWRTRARWWCGWVGFACLAVLAGCQVAPRTEDVLPLFPNWEAKPLPGKRWQPFVPVVVDGVPGLQVESQASLSLLRTRFRPYRTQPAQLQFSWWVNDLLPEADLTDSQASDAPAQVALAFDGDRSQLSGRFAVLSELTQLVTGDPLPYATLIYVWSTGPEHPVGSVIKDPRTDRIRYLVVEQGSAHLRRWVHHRRQIHADYARVFGEPAGPLMGMAIMSDSDNTGGRARAVFGRVTLGP
jgi:hypothetical protein